MTEREIRTATYFGCLEITKKIEAEVSNLPDVTDVEFDLDGMEYDQFIILTKYNIPGILPTDEYFERRHNLRKNVIQIMKEHGFYKTADRIEDYGEHFYFVFMKRS